MSEQNATRRGKSISSDHPMHIVLIADDSGSMAAKRDGRSGADDATEAIQNWVAELQLQTKGRKPYFRFTLISFGSAVDILAEAKDLNAIDVVDLPVDG